MSNESYTGRIKASIDEYNQKIQRGTYTSSSGVLITRLAGDASNRSYYRIKGELSTGINSNSLVAMVLATEPFRSEEIQEKTKIEELPFINILNFFQEGDIPVPRLYAYDAANGILVLEDLGDVTLEMLAKEGDRRGVMSLYERVLGELIQIQLHAASFSKTSTCIAFGRSFTEKLLRWELEHFTEYGLEAKLNARLSPKEREIFDRAYQWLVQEILAVPYIFVHRDYQSRNIMWKEGKPYVIDFQDALMGPPVYDLVSLLRDSYVEFEPNDVDILLDRYYEMGQANNLKLLPRENLFRLFHLVTIQRKLKDTGRFVFIDRVKKNPKFLQHIPTSFRYVMDALHHFPELAGFEHVLAQYENGIVQLES
jgi:hypothetical protein